MLTLNKLGLLTGGRGYWNGHNMETIWARTTYYCYWKALPEDV